MTHVATFEDTDPVVQYHPGVDNSSTDAWTTLFPTSIPALNGASQGVGNSVRRASAAGSSLSLQFYGTSIQLYGKSFGSVYTVGVDGKPGQVTTDQDGVLARVQGLEPGLHSLVLNLVQPSPCLDFDRAVFDVGQATLGNETVAHDFGWHYEGDWKVGTFIKPALDENQSVHLTGTAGSWASVPFQGSAVYLYGNLMPDHRRYEVELDGTVTQLNGYAGTLVQRAVLYFAAGLDPGVNHTLIVRNLDGSWLDVDHINVIRLESLPRQSVTTTENPSMWTKLPTTDHPTPRVGLIVGAVLSGLAFLLLTVFLILFCIRRRNLRKRFCAASVPTPYQSLPTPRLVQLSHPAHDQRMWFPPDTQSMYHPSTAPDVRSYTESEASQSRWGRERRWAEGVATAAATSEYGSGGTISVVGSGSRRTRHSGTEGSVATTDTEQSV